MPRHADFAHDENLERNAQRARHLQPRRHSAPRQSEHENVGSAAVFQKFRRQDLSGFFTVAKRHAFSIEQNAYQK